MNEAQKAGVRAVFDKHLGTESELQARETGEYQRAETGDIFQTPEGVIAKVFRSSRKHGWADILVVDQDFSSWSKRMPLGIPASWGRLPRR